MKKIIALSSNYGYLDKAETTIKSILYNNQHVKIYLFNYDIPQEWFTNINRYAKQIDSEIVDAKFERELISNVYVVRKRLNEMTYARLLIPKLIPESKVLYLDCDLIVDDNLDDLFNIDFNGNKILAVLDIFSGHPKLNVDEFNAGVMLIDNEQLKKIPNISEELIRRGVSEHNYNADQAIINSYFKNEIGILPLEYNYEIGYDHAAFWNNNQDLVKLLDSVQHPKIIHYALDDKPYNMISHGRMREKWWFYRNLELGRVVQKHTFFDLIKAKKRPHFDGELFTFTGSGNIQHLEELIQKMPNYHFSVAAWTDVSWNLKELLKYPNFSIYPHIIGKHLDSLVENADFYLDINYGGKDQNVIQRIEDNNCPIISFADTADRENEYPNYKIFENDQIDDVINFIKSNQ